MFLGRSLRWATQHHTSCAARRPPATPTTTTTTTTLFPLFGRARIEPPCRLHVAHAARAHTVAQFLNTDEEKPAVLQLTLGVLDIGTKTNVAAIQVETPLISVLNMFVERNISALPIVDQGGKVVDIYAKGDAISLARERTYNNLDVSVSTALKFRENFEGVHTCTLDDSLGKVIDRIVAHNVHRLVIVDSHGVLVGIVSLSDIFAFLLL